MGWEMDSHGNWKQSSGSGNTTTSTSNKSDKSVTDKGNTSDTDKAIKNSTANKENKIKYAEESSFTCLGDATIRKGGYLTIGKGVAKRWKGKWKILQTTHKLGNNGYTTEGTLGRIPYKEEAKSTGGKSGNTKGNNSSKGNKGNKDNKNGNPKQKDNSSEKWVMDKNGTWHKKKG